MKPADHAPRHLAYMREQLAAIDRLAERFPRDRVERLVEDAIDRAEAAHAAYQAGEITAAELVRRTQAIAGELRYGDELQQAVWGMLFSDSEVLAGDADSEAG